MMQNLNKKKQQQQKKKQQQQSVYKCSRSSMRSVEREVEGAIPGHNTSVFTDLSGWAKIGQPSVRIM